MKKILFFGCVLAGGVSAGIYGQSPKPAGQPSKPALVISHLTGNFYVYTTVVDNFPANGLYLVTGKGVVLIDCPYDTTQCQSLLDSIQQKHHQRVVLDIATHFHRDRTGALSFFRSKGIRTYSSRLTDKYSKARGMPRAEFLFDKDTSFTVGGYTFEVYFPGEGHTKDNVVVWFGRDRVLDGGCFIKSTEATDLGNVADANVAAWPASVRRLQQRFPNPAYVIPGHQGWASTKSVQHTIDLAVAGK